MKFQIRGRTIFESGLPPVSPLRAPRHVRIGQETVSSAATTGIALGGFIPDRVLESATTPPSSVQAQMDRVNASWATLAAQVQAAALTDPGFLDGFTTDKAAWDSFYGDNRTLLTIAARGSQNVLRQTEAFRLRLVGWNGAFEGLTGKKALVPPAGEEQKREQATGEGAPPWWAISIGTLAVAGAVGYVGWQAYHYFDKKRGGSAGRDRAGYDATSYDAGAPMTDRDANEDAARQILRAPPLPPATRARADRSLLRRPRRRDAYFDHSFDAARQERDFSADYDHPEGPDHSDGRPWGRERR